MAYGDFNPIRAALADELVDSDHTTIFRRLRALEARSEVAEAPLARIAGLETAPDLGFSGGQYIASVDWQGC